MMHARILGTLGLLVTIPIGCDGDGPMTPQDCTGVELDGICWTFLGLDNDWVVDIEVTPWGTFVSTLDRGIFRLDAGGRWNALGPELWHDHLIADALLYVPSDPPRLLAGVRYRHGTREDTTIATVFASHDRGESWVPSDGGFAADAPNPYRVYAEDLEVDPGDPRRVFMTFSWSGMLRSLDAGETWQLVLGRPDIFGGYQPDIFIDPSRSGRIWVAQADAFGVPGVAASHDWGDTWGEGSRLKCGGVTAEFFAYALALDPNRTGRLWVGVDGGVMWADDGGEAEGDWRCDFFAAPKGAVVAFAELDRTLYAAAVFVELRFEDGGVTEITELGLYRAADGVTWDSLPVPPDAVGATVGVADSANDRLLIGTRGGLWAVRP
jgi:hypothetical protein